jgi:2-methylcitrate dehydratase PrpD
MTTYLDQLAQFAAKTTVDDVDEATMVAVQDVVLDTVGAMLAGSREPENHKLAQWAAQESGAGTSRLSTTRLIGHRLEARPMFAALSNSAAGVALEVDEGNRWGGGHPAIHTVPAALATAEVARASGSQIIESVLVGYEVLSRIGGATQAYPQVHAHGTWGAIGTAVAVAKLRGWDAPAMQQVINLAASMSPANTWSSCFAGATIRNLYPGRAALNGMLAVQLAGCGFNGLDDGPSDVYDGFLGQSFDRDAVVEGLGQGYRIAQNYFKFHSCCLYNHPALDAVLSLSRQHSIDASQVQRVEITTVPFAAEFMAYDDPENQLSAKFSLPHAVAAALVRGRTDVTSFYPDQVAETGIRQLATRVKVDTDPQMSMRRHDYPSAQVTIGLKDGQQLKGETVIVRGDRANPVTREELVDKFLFLSQEILGEKAAGEVVEVVHALQELTDIRELMGLLVPVR